MILILSPAKNLDFKSEVPDSEFTLPEFQSKSNSLTRILKRYSREDLASLMKINPKLADLNYTRYKLWSKELTPEYARQALFAFNGEVYNGLQAKNLSKEAIAFAQDHLRILSGLYGILRPLDLIQPYRLEMGIPLKNGKHKNLYEFWGNQLSKHLLQLAKDKPSDSLINLASNEYSKAARLSQFKGRIITPVFKQLKGEKLTTITIYMKKARGLMSRFILENQLEDPEEIKLFDWEDYFYDENLSSENEWVFVR